MRSRTGTSTWFSARCSRMRRPEADWKRRIPPLRRRSASASPTRAAAAFGGAASTPRGLARWSVPCSGGHRMTTLAAPRVRGRCPGVRRPMATGDGLLARLHPPGGRLTTAQAVGVAEAGEFCGSGLLEVTGRGNFQIRGIREEAQSELQARVDRLGLLEPSADGPHRLTIVSPLAGIDPSDCIDAGELADAIETSCRSIPGLPAKIGVAVD